MLEQSKPTWIIFMKRQKSWKHKGNYCWDKRKEQCKESEGNEIGNQARAEQERHNTPVSKESEASIVFIIGFKGAARSNNVSQWRLFCVHFKCIKIQPQLSADSQHNQRSQSGPRQECLKAKPRHVSVFVFQRGQSADATSGPRLGRFKSPVAWNSGHFQTQPIRAAECDRRVAGTSPQPPAGETLAHIIRLTAGCLRWVSGKAIHHGFLGNTVGLGVIPPITHGDAA